MIAESADPPVKYFVDFAGTKSKEILRRCHLPPGSVAHVFPPNEIQNLFDELIRCGQRGGRQSAELCAKLLECLALKMAGRARRWRGRGSPFVHHLPAMPPAHRGKFPAAQDAAADCAGMPHGRRLPVPALSTPRSTKPIPIFAAPENEPRRRMAQQPGALVKQVAERAGFRDPFHFSAPSKACSGLRLTFSGGCVELKKHCSTPDTKRLQKRGLQLVGRTNFAAGQIRERYRKENDVISRAVH